MAEDNQPDKEVEEKDEVLTSGPAAAMLNMSIPTLLRYTKAGEVPHLPTTTKWYRYSKKALLEYIASRSGPLTDKQKETAE